LKIQRLISHSSSQHFFYGKPEVSFPCLQQHATCPCPEPHESSYHFCKIHFNIVLPSTFGVFLVFSFLHVLLSKSYVHFFPMPETCPKPLPSFLSSRSARRFRPFDVFRSSVSRNDHAVSLVADRSLFPLGR
jgi:hypothetical protein